MRLAIRETMAKYFAFSTPSYLLYGILWLFRVPEPMRNLVWIVTFLGIVLYDKRTGELTKAWDDSKPGEGPLPSSGKEDGHQNHQVRLDHSDPGVE